MSYIIVSALSLIAGFVAGALVFRKHAAKASELEAKGKSILDVLKNR
jgi:hypothetical protein